jgi:flavin reductase (DIM6/NTAB) family NADH-FMN oxidoreductase RutF
MTTMNSSDNFSHFDLTKLPQADAYKLLTSVIVPRPIAWIVSVDCSNSVNAAPFSFFNIVASDPPMVAVGFSGGHDSREKDTLANIIALGEFVVNMVPEELVEAMNITAVDAPRGVDETRLAGLDLAPGSAIRGFRIVDSPAALECKLYQVLRPGISTICLARIVYVHVRTEAFTNLSRLHVDGAKLQLIGRMQSPSSYTRTRDTFQVVRKEWPLSPKGLPK